MESLKQELFIISSNKGSEGDEGKKYGWCKQF